jgi:hypothetical protein
VCTGLFWRRRTGSQRSPKSVEGQFPLKCVCYLTSARLAPQFPSGDILASRWRLHESGLFTYRLGMLAELTVVGFHPSRFEREPSASS